MMNGCMMDRPSTIQIVIFIVHCTESIELYLFIFIKINDIYHIDRLFDLGNYVILRDKSELNDARESIKRLHGRIKFLKNKIFEIQNEVQQNGNGVFMPRSEPLRLR